MPGTLLTPLVCWCENVNRGPATHTSPLLSSCVGEATRAKCHAAPRRRLPGARWPRRPGVRCTPGIAASPPHAQAASRRVEVPSTCPAGAWARCPRSTRPTATPLRRRAPRAEPARPARGARVQVRARDRAGRALLASCRSAPSASPWASAGALDLGSWMRHSGGASNAPSSAPSTRQPPWQGCRRPCSARPSTRRRRGAAALAVLFCSSRVQLPSLRRVER